MGNGEEIFSIEIKVCGYQKKELLEESVSSILLSSNKKKAFEMPCSPCEITL